MMFNRLTTAGWASNLRKGSQFGFGNFRQFLRPLAKTIQRREVPVHAAHDQTSSQIKVVIFLVRHFPPHISCLSLSEA